jgi:4-carboxymuconolactone decarboxylase
MSRNGTDRLKEGMTTRRAVLGDEYVDRMEVTKNGFDGAFQDLITEAAWGHVWSRPDWNKRDRSIVTIALLAALGHYDEMAMHIRATARTGATMDDIREVMLHVAIYAGVPAANAAIKVAKQALADVAEGRTD